MDEHFTHDPIPILGGSFFMLIDLHILISINNAKQRRMRRIHGYDLLSEKKNFLSIADANLKKFLPWHPLLGLTPRLENPGSAIG